MRMHALALLLLLAPQDRAELKKEYDARLQALSGGKEPAPYVELGDWCRGNKLIDEAKACYKKAEQLAPAHDGAVAGMKALGYVLEARIWMPAKDLFLKKLKAARGDLEARFELALWARGFGLEKEAKAEIEALVKERPLHRGARLALGFKELHARYWTEAELARETKLDDAFAKALEGGGADEVLKQAKAAGWTGTASDAAKIVEWNRNKPEGGNDRAMTYAGTQAVYSFGVPDSYRPWRPVPLVVFLHGGGDGVGDGKDYVGRLWPPCKERGFICVCPTTLEKKRDMWGTERYVGYIRAVVAEFRSRYNIDPDRIYLMGHSRGSYGCFYIGCLMTDVFASLASSSCGAGGASIEKLTRTPTLLVHGDKDEVCPVNQSRGDFERLQKLKVTVAYWELPGVGHSLPEESWAKQIDWVAQWTKAK